MVTRCTYVFWVSDTADFAGYKKKGQYCSCMQYGPRLPCCLLDLMSQRQLTLPPICCCLFHADSVGSSTHAHTCLSVSACNVEHATRKTCLYVCQKEGRVLSLAAKWPWLDSVFAYSRRHCRCVFNLSVWHLNRLILFPMAMAST